MRAEKNDHSKLNSREGEGEMTTGRGIEEVEARGAGGIRESTLPVRSATNDSMCVVMSSTKDDPTIIRL